MFSNLKLGMRLGLGFGLVLALLATIAFSGISRLAAVNASVEDSVNDIWRKTTLLQEGLVGVNEIGIGASDMAFTSSNVGRLAAKERVLAGRAGMGEVRERFVIILDANRILSTAETTLIGQSGHCLSAAKRLMRLESTNH